MLLAVLQAGPQTGNTASLVGAWEATMPENTKALWIMDDDYFARTYYKADPAEFIGTEGGKWSRQADGTLLITWEFNTNDPGKVGTTERMPINPRGQYLETASASWKRLDDGTPGALRGAWLITGRQLDGTMNTMTPGARKTMKILSGTRFQWIAYNSETGEFGGTGGGAYTTEGDTYTEHIHFFSRDNSRVGASLSFPYELKEGKWHHRGKSSKGDPIYEIWSSRQSLGI
ncbi:hypothetical protein ADICEAN_01724 [Cesiribacter andamanensis AMV16]|uniref:Membrane or secreted protein n=2 Tax=Cesiribacter TaxID=1133570 RepID=M7N359_9BACT|nr:hypothetical protein ADICEAN_01724 [Cesiribacter andamanensis AMV16]